MADEKVSVIVPVYNVEKYLRRCLDSIINQTYQNLEIILVDDGSPDNCGSICDEYAQRDERIQVIHKENGGLSSARNAALDIATGNFITFIDSDDWVAEAFIEKLCAYASPDSMVVANLFFWKSPLEITPAMKIGKNETINSEEFWRRTTGTECTPYIISCSKLYPKRIFARLRFSEGLFHEDEDILHRVVAQVERFHVISEPIYFYRQNNASIMGQGFSPRRLDGFVGWAKRLAYFHEIGLYEAEDALASKYWTRYKDQIFWVDPYKDAEGHRKKAIEYYKMAFPSLIKAKSISLSQKISVIAMRISPECFLHLWRIINFLSKRGKA